MLEILPHATWLDLHKLRLFMVVAEHEHYSRASVALGISQPALTVHVRDLERHFGVPLFERAGRNVRLTEAGRLVLDYARRLFALADELDETVGDLRAGRTGTLRLGASTTIGDYLLPGVLGTFRARHPGIAITVEIANTGQIADRVREGTLHLGLVGEAPQGSDLVATPYLDDDIVLVVSPRHAWAGRTILALDLVDAPLVVRERGSATREAAAAALASRGIRLPVALELGGTESVKGAVGAGLGVAFVSACATITELATGRLAQVSIADLTIRRQFHLVQRRDRRLTAAETAFLAILALPANMP
jgi:DNA-binding transcriptional LysR family regulator